MKEGVLRAQAVSVRCVGEEAELLVWLFCSMRRDTFDQNLDRVSKFSLQHRITGEWLPLTDLQFNDLITLTFASTLEAFPRLEWSTRRACLAYLRPFRRVAIPATQAAFDEFDSPLVEDLENVNSLFRSLL